MEKSYTNREVHKATLEYFGGTDELASSVWISKYALRDENGNLLELTPDDMHHRIAKELARIEKRKFKAPLPEETIFECLKDFKRILPAGSSLFGIGNDNQIVSISNCMVVPPVEDSYGGIFHSDQQLAQLMKRRCGVGLDISNLRPKGKSVKNAAGTTDGINIFMERFSNTCREVAQSGRRGALLLSIAINHPEILTFLNIKNDLTKVTGANLSVRISDEFMKSIHKNLDNKKIWKNLIKNAHNHGEPGVLFWDTIVRNNPSDCYEELKTIGVNPCAEQTLSGYGSCSLIALNLFSYVENPFENNAKFDYELFYNDAQIAQRLIDDIIDLELEKIDSIIEKIDSDSESGFVKQPELFLWNNIKHILEIGRRTGIGITALADTFAALNIKYGSRKSINITEKIYKTLKLGCYRSSVDMAKEIGPFPLWDYGKEKDNPFLLRIKEEDKQLYKDMKKYGRRNVACLTTAPTGTISILAQCSSGIEPLFMLEYIRRRKIKPNEEIEADFIDASGDHWQEYIVFPPKIKMWMEITGEKDLRKSPWWGCCAEDLDWMDRITLQSKAQIHIDGAISSTLNLPENITYKTVGDIYEYAWQKGLKGVTIYRKNSRSGVLIDGPQITKTKAPKRPKELPCDVFHTTTLGKEYLVLVGKLNGEPYEVFAIKNDNSPKNIKAGKITRIRSGCYNVEFDNGEIIKDIMNHATPAEEAITRLVSTALRHGSEIQFISEQLSKTKGNISGFEKAIARSLRKCITDGIEVSNEECQECGCKLIYQSGCAICSNCGWSFCS